MVNYLLASILKPAMEPPTVVVTAPITITVSIDLTAILIPIAEMPFDNKCIEWIWFDPGKVRAR